MRCHLLCSLSVVCLPTTLMTLCSLCSWECYLHVNDQAGSPGQSLLSGQEGQAWGYWGGSGHPSPARIASGPIVTAQQEPSIQLWAN